MQKVRIECSLNKNDKAWNKELDAMFEKIDGLLSVFPNNPTMIVRSVKRVGCDLLVTYDLDGEDPQMVKFWKEMISGQISMLEKVLVSTCARCGTFKGPPACTTVRPGLCEQCRSRLTRGDFEHNVAIGMIGKAGSGKDSVANYLVDRKSFERIAFADPIRDIVQLVLVMDRINVWDRKLRELPLPFLKPMLDGALWTVRKLLQLIGTEMFRNMVDRDIWVANASKRMEPGTNYIITDVRFPNEVELVKKNYGGRCLLIKVTRPGYDGKEVGISGHESESYDLEADIVIENDGTLEDLYQKIEKTLKEYNVLQ